MTYVVPFREIDLGSVPEVGGKNASLGELLRELSPAGILVPDGFAITSSAFRLHLEASRLGERIYSQLETLDVENVALLHQIGEAIREQIRSAPLPAEVEAQALAAYRTLSRTFGEDATDVAVRSSATAEDLPTASFAGQQETYLNVRGEAQLIEAIRSCMASLFTDRAIVYRAERGFDHRQVALSVGVQKMVRSDLASAGVIFTLDTESGFDDVVIVTGAWGLGETVVQGKVNPDEFWVHKPTLDKGFAPIVRRQIGDKVLGLFYSPDGKTVEERQLASERRSAVTLSDAEVLQLSRWAMRIEQHYSAKAGKRTPMDIEWAKDGRSGQLFIVQARPETVHSRKGPPKLEFFRVLGEGRVLSRGKSVGGKVGFGRVRVIRSSAELSTFQAGEVLVAPMTDPDWEPILKRAAAVVTDQGGRTCHAAIVSRELGLPCVVGAGDATHTLHEGALVTVSCAEGDEGRVYEGHLRFERREIDPATLPHPRVPVMLNVGSPVAAFHLAQLPSAGVGLLRTEFVVSSWIGVHPMALVHPERVTNGSHLAQIRELVRHSANPAEFFVERLASGVAQVAAAFYPRDVIVRFSDFKTNEYAHLLGGDSFEPSEENPMIGFRGASRYYHERYREGFELECRAIHRVREEMGLSNVKVMIPFCRTLEEGRKVLAELAANGLSRGKNGLEVYVMCEIPNNVILAEEFAELFDGFSIGSNDLTQLTLGVDRDSETLAPLFSEQDPGVMRSIATVIERAHKHGRKVGLCGQGPSDHPEFARFLADAGIDSISVTSDALPDVLAVLAESEAQRSNLTTVAAAE
ncbi:MAG TPA: phosphoenolpyruvate synthase [Polyangiaceae bacterium]|nr:phosphoenolpyruvate synthase [Polyangiaceae bacterium]